MSTTVTSRAASIRKRAPRSPGLQQPADFDLADQWLIGEAQQASGRAWPDCADASANRGCDALAPCFVAGDVNVQSRERFHYGIMRGARDDHDVRAVRERSGGGSPDQGLTAVFE